MLLAQSVDWTAGLTPAKGPDMELSVDFGKQFQKLLVARFSPRNKCFVPDGELLLAPPPKEGSKVKHGSSHKLVSGIDHRTSSKFGWVKSEEVAFTLIDFLTRCGRPSPTHEQAQVALQMLDAISRLADGVPVAATYVSRGVERRRVVLTVHKVFFCQPLSSPG